MAWQKPQTIEIKMDAELTSYQGDDELPWLTAPQPAAVERPGVPGRRRDARGAGSAPATPHGSGRV